MILCPNCHHQELPGALFCSECGAQLILSDSMITHSFRPSSSELQTIPVDSHPPDMQNGKRVPAEAIDSILSLQMLDSDQVLHLTGRNEYTLGRIAEGQPILPDVDLSNFQAYAQGVSRLHAVLKIRNHQIAIRDLGSSNGTRVNGQKIVPQVDYPLSHGDIITLGKLKIRVVYH